MKDLKYNKEGLKRILKETRDSLEIELKTESYKNSLKNKSTMDLEEWHKKWLSNLSPFSHLFFYPTNIGELMEKISVNIFDIFEEKKEKTTEYDILESNTANNKVEVKIIRATKANEKDNYLSLFERRLSIKNKNRLSNQSFQQVKPDKFHSLLGLVIFEDRIDIYFFKNTDFTFEKSSNLISLIGQHAGNKKEGQTGSLKKIEAYKIGYIDSLLDYYKI